MTDDYVGIKVQFDEDDVIQAKVRLDRIKAIADTLTTIDRNGYADELSRHTVMNMMETIDAQANEAKGLLKY